ncbi:MAG: HlyD family secretion protein [Acidobacteriota bacterium]
MAGKRLWIIAAVVIVFAAGGFWLWRTLSPRESTDDAQMTGHVSPVAARVAGTVKAILVSDNQVVKAGDVLVEIDRRDYEIAVARAEADLAAAEAHSRAARAGVPVTSAAARGEEHSANAGTGNAEAALRAADREVDASRAKLNAAKARQVEAAANATRASQDLERMRPLAAKDEISKQQFDAAATTAQATQAAAESAVASVHEAEANLDVSEAKRVQSGGMLTQARAQAQAAATAPQQIALTQAQAAGADAQVLQAQAALDQARVNLERTTVTAPSAGVISRKSIEVGQVIQPSQQLMAITSLGDVWVTANFKETQLASMRVGQKASIDVDAYGHAVEGHVESIAAATGATFSLLPPDNATGNFVKVVQRIPVKIVLDKQADQGTPLRPGMSVNATVYVK